MYIFVIALIFTSSVCAKLPMKTTGKTQQEEPKPCCAPSQFTQEYRGSSTSVAEGNLLEERISIAFAYDSIEEKTSGRYRIGFTNGTEEYIRTIIDYKQEELYTIIKQVTGDTCFKSKVEQGFDYVCIPDHAKYVGSPTIGDRALDLDVWLVTEESGSETTNIEEVFQKDECVPIRNVYRTFDSETGEQLYITSLDAINFKLGICDEGVFHVPDICNESGLSKGEPKLPEQLLKLHRLGLARAVGLYVGGK